MKINLSNATDDWSEWRPTERGGRYRVRLLPKKKKAIPLSALRNKPKSISPDDILNLTPEQFKEARMKSLPRVVWQPRPLGRFYPFKQSTCSSCRQRADKGKSQEEAIEFYAWPVVRIGDRARWISWMGFPYLLRWRLRLPRTINETGFCYLLLPVYKKKYPGCGCVFRLKEIHLKIKSKIIALHRRCLHA